MKIMNHYTIVGSLYANYIMQSIAVIIIMQLSFVLTVQLNTDLIGLGYVASGIGVGKILFMFLAGLFSDKWGRRCGILTGMLCYVIFFLGLIFCTSVTEAFLLTVLAGIGNAFLDTGSMPALMELFPTSASSASVLIKAFISIGTLILPFIVTFIYQSGIWYGYVLIFFAVFLVCNALLLSRAAFPKKTIQIQVSQSKTKPMPYFIGKPNIRVEGVCLVLMGFTITATFVVIMQWLPAIAMQVADMEQMAAKQLISDYSTGSIIAVLITAYGVKKLIKPIYCVALFPFLSSLILGLFIFYPSPAMCKTVAFVMGFTAAGGILQLTLVVMQQLFPRRKGRIVGTMYTLSGLAFVVIPLIIPRLTMLDACVAILFNFLMAFLSTLLAMVVIVRFKRVIDLKCLSANAR